MKGHSDVRYFDHIPPICISSLYVIFMMPRTTVIHTLVLHLRHHVHREGCSAYSFPCP